MIRDATRDDIPQMAGLISDFYNEAPYEAPLIDPEKTAYVLAAYIAASRDAAFCKVIDIDGLLTGLLIAERMQDLWSSANKVCEILMYVRPAFRKRPSAGRLMLSFATWSQEIPSVVRLSAESGIDDPSVSEVFAKLGWERRGVLHGMEAYV